MKQLRARDNTPKTRQTPANGFFCAIYGLELKRLSKKSPVSNAWSGRHPQVGLFLGASALDHGAGGADLEGQPGR